MKPLLVTMRGGGKLDVPTLSNFEAGIAFLSLVNTLIPGITWSQLEDLARAYGTETMGSLWSAIKHVAGDIKDGVGDVLKDTYTTVGKGAGDALRLVTDGKVIDGAARIGSAYATDGGSEGARSLLQNLGLSSDSSNQVMDFISSLGSSFKSQSNTNAASVGSVNAGMILPWALAGGAVLVLLVGRRR